MISIKFLLLRLTYRVSILLRLDMEGSIIPFNRLEDKFLREILNYVCYYAIITDQKCAKHTS